MAGEKYLQILISEWYFNLLFPKGWGGGGGRQSAAMHGWLFSILF